MRFPLLLGAAGALLGSFGVAGLANGMWATPSAWEHSRAGFQIALGLPYGFQEAPVVFSRADRLALINSSPEGLPPNQDRELARAPDAPLAVTSPARISPKSHSIETAHSDEQAWMLAQVSPAEPPAPPEPPEPPAPAPPPSAIQGPNGGHVRMDAALAQGVAHADRQALRAARASLKAAQIASKASMLVSTIELEVSATTGKDLRQLQIEVNEAKTMLRVAQALSNRVQAGDSSKISVNYGSQTCCGSANMVPGCLPLKPSDLARIRSESTEQLNQAQLDLRQAQDSLARAQQVDPSQRSRQDHLTDG